MTRDEHMKWCKERALQYIDDGDIQNGITSMLSDLSKHPETKAVGENMAPLGMLEIMSGSVDSARRFVTGFN